MGNKYLWANGIFLLQFLDYSIMSFELSGILLVAEHIGSVDNKWDRSPFTSLFKLIVKVMNN